MNMKITHHEATFLSECLECSVQGARSYEGVGDDQSEKFQQRPQVEARLLPVERKLERVGAKWMVGKCEKFQNWPKKE